MDTWRDEYPNGLVDVNDERFFPITDFDAYDNAWDSMTQSTREEIDKRYEEELV